MNKEKTYISLNSFELNDLIKHYPSVGGMCKSFDFDNYWLITNEEQLSHILYYLPHKHYLRDRLQQAGDLVFKWNTGYNR